jgi:hypothetical protein
MERANGLQIVTLIIAILALILALYSVMIPDDEVTDETENVAPTATIYANKTMMFPGESVSFDASDSSDSDGTIVEYQWYFGDGIQASGSSVEHTFTNFSSYTVVLVVYDNDGASGIDTITISGDIVSLLYGSITGTTTSPTGAFSFTETSSPGNYSGGLVSLSSTVYYANASVTIIDVSTSDSAFMDPLQNGSAIQAGSGLTLAYRDTNENLKLDAGDVWTISNGASGDVIKLIHNTGKIIAEYTLQ